MTIRHITYITLHNKMHLSLLAYCTCICSVAPKQTKREKIIWTNCGGIIIHFAVKAKGYWKSAFIWSQTGLVQANASWSRACMQHPAGDTSHSAKSMGFTPIFITVSLTLLQYQGETNEVGNMHVNL